MWNRMGAEVPLGGAYGFRPVGMTQEIRPSSVILPNFFVLGQTVQAWWRIRLKNLTHRFQPFKVTQTYRIDTDRSTTFAFLLMFHSNHGLMLYLSEINGDFSIFQQTAIFFPSSCVWRPRWDGSPCNWATALGIKNTRMMEAIWPIKSFMTCLAVWKQYASVTDRQTPADSM